MEVDDSKTITALYFSVCGHWSWFVCCKMIPPFLQPFSFRETFVDQESFLSLVGPCGAMFTKAAHDMCI